MAELSPVDVLVNNAGTLAAIAPLAEADADEWWLDVDTTVRGAFNCTRAVLPGCWNAGAERSSTFRATPRFVGARTRAATRLHAVRTKPGLIAKTTTPLPAVSAASVSVKLSRAAFAPRGASSAAAAVRAMSSMCTIGQQGVTGLSGACSVTSSSPETPYIEHDEAKMKRPTPASARRPGQAHARALVDLERQLRVEVAERVRWRERPGGRSRRSCGGASDRGCRAACSRPRRRGTRAPARATRRPSAARPRPASHGRAGARSGRAWPGGPRRGSRPLAQAARAAHRQPACRAPAPAPSSPRSAHAAAPRAQRPE